MRKLNTTRNKKLKNNLGSMPQTKSKRIIMVKLTLIVIFSYGLSLYSNGENFPFGMNNTVYSEFNEQKYQNNVKLYKQTIDSAAALGIKWWRAMNKFTWLSVEETEGSYDWSNEDSLVKWTGERDIHIIPVIGYIYPKWAHHTGILPEDSIYWYKYPFDPGKWEAYMKFTQDMAERYDGDDSADMPGLVLPVKYWECMNEPYDNIKTFYGNIKQYAEIFDSTRAALKRADPEAKLGGPCLNSKNTNLTWYYYDINTNELKDTTYPYINMLNEILGRIENIDFITHHIYHYELQGPKKTMADLRDIRNEVGDSIPIWITECGYQWYQYYHKYYNDTFDNRYSFYTHYYPYWERDTVWIADTALIYWVDTTDIWTPARQAEKYSELLDSIHILLDEESNYKFFFYSINPLTLGLSLKYNTILEIGCSEVICTLRVKKLTVNDPLWEDHTSTQLSILRGNFNPLPAYYILKNYIENNFHKP